MSGTELTAIPHVRQVLYDTYANLSGVGLSVGDFGYATDRKVLYRWSGSAFQAITISSRAGNYADRGTEADYPENSIYRATDQGKVYMQIGGTWTEVAGVSGINFCDTEVYATDAPDSFTDLDLSAVVGANNALVLLRVTNDDILISHTLQFRENGGSNYDAIVTAHTGSGAVVGVVWVRTDAAGIIEWQASGAGKDTTLDVLAYVK